MELTIEFVPDDGVWCLQNKGMSFVTWFAHEEDAVFAKALFEKFPPPSLVLAMRDNPLEVFNSPEPIVKPVGHKMPSSEEIKDVMEKMMVSMAVPADVLRGDGGQLIRSKDGDRFISEHTRKEEKSSAAMDLLKAIMNDDDGIPPTEEELAFLKKTSEDIYGVSYVWEIPGANGEVAERWWIPAGWVTQHISAKGNHEWFEVHRGGISKSPMGVQIPAGQIRMQINGHPHGPQQTPQGIVTPPAVVCSAGAEVPEWLNEHFKKAFPIIDAACQSNDDCDTPLIVEGTK